LVKKALGDSGFAVVEQLIDSDTIAVLREEADALLRESAGRGGARNVLGKSSLLRNLATSGEPARLAASILGRSSRPTKLTIFDKTPHANWKVPWHQDLTIAVAARADVPGFGPWSVKDGVVHVQPPVLVLQQILAIRLHLDDTPPSNGALRVLPGTHRLGRVTESQIDALRNDTPAVVCPVSAGGAMLMSPLLLHASSQATVPCRRRVLHFEYSAAPLPEDLVWA
jgi:ectoine hydroxylase-related dioxygenase (phytanoyl-CoA dioxygenase family)